MRALILALLLLLPGLSSAAGGFLLKSTQPDFLPADQAFALTVTPLENGTTELYWRIAPGYYLYQKRLQFQGVAERRQPQLPDGESHSDEFFGATEVYRQSLTLIVPAGTERLMQLSWQGCADAGLCYPVQSRDISLNSSQLPDASSVLADDQALAGEIQARALFWSLLLFFGLGLLLAFTPCSLPMLPILAGVVVGSGASPRRGLALATTYVIAMALVYAGLGVTAALMGANLQAWLQQPWLLATFAAVFLLLALPMFGFFELQLPAALRDRLETAGRRQQGGSLLGAGVLGVLSGLLVGPCMTAPLAAALLFIAQSGDAVQGGLVLFSLGLGIGTPLLLLVTLGNRFIPKPGAWMDKVKVLFGFLFLATALFIARPLFSEPLWLGVWAVWSITLAIGLLHMKRNHPAQHVMLRAAGATLGLWGIAMLVGAAGGSHDPRQPLAVYAGGAVAAASVDNHAPLITDLARLDAELAAARADGQWVLLDYYADWCVACKTMEKEVFGNRDVQAALTGVKILRPDVTLSNADSQALLGRYEVLGPPTLLWIGPDGQERRVSRITGQVDAQAFLQRWNQVKERG